MVFTRLLSSTDVYHDGSWYVGFVIAILPKSQSYWVRANTDVSNLDCDGY